MTSIHAGRLLEKHLGNVRGGKQEEEGVKIIFCWLENMSAVSYKRAKKCLYGKKIKKI